VDARCEGSTRDQRRDAGLAAVLHGGSVQVKWRSSLPSLTIPLVLTGFLLGFGFAVADNSSVIGGALLISL
jgi:hypothetical protein